MERVSTPIQFDFSSQRCMKQQRSEAASTCLCITIRFVLLAISFLQYDQIYPDSDFGHISAMKQLAHVFMHLHTI